MPGSGDRRRRLRPYPRHRDGVVGVLIEPDIVKSLVKLEVQGRSGRRRNSFAQSKLIGVESC